jgi:hypothetical protein
MQSCSSSYYEEYREEGQGTLRKLLKELRKIRNRDDLAAVTPNLEKLFLQLAQTMVVAKRFQEKNPQTPFPEFSTKDHELSDQVRTELNRIYRLEGGREGIEKCQETALKFILTN